jgi:uncharacterized DUF497 family protein
MERIVWDEPKRLANIAKHKLDFADLTVEFFGNAFVTPARERRLIAIGRLADNTLAVIFVELGSEAGVGDLDAACQPT